MTSQALKYDVITYTLYGRFIFNYFTPYENVSVKHLKFK